MKKLYSPFLKGINGALAALLFLMGFSACEKYEAVMYGSPHATFSIKGKVQTEAKTGIPEIKVQMALVASEENEIYDSINIPLKTDEKGEFSTTFTAPYFNKIRVYATDVDGTKNGTFTKDSVDIQFDPTDFKGGKDWNWGHAEKEITIELKETKENE